MTAVADTKTEYLVVNQKVYNIQLVDKQVETKVNFLADCPVQSNIQKFVVVENFLSGPECDHIQQYFARIDAMNGKVSGKTVHKQTRDSALRWLRLPEHPETAWLFERIFAEAARVNDENWQFRLDGFESSLQLTEYETGGHYTWHQDMGSGRSSLRKLSISIQLSDPNEYEGCNLELHATQKPVPASRAKGALVIFPSYTLHRVTPVQSGLRRAIVTWIGGLTPYR